MGLPTLKRSAIGRLAAAAALALVLAGCLPRDPGAQLAGWSIVDPSERHPIMVTQQPAVMSLRIARGAYGLSPAQRAQAIGFLERYRATDAGNAKLVIQAPSGAANEVAAMHAVAELRHLMLEIGIDQTSIAVETYPAGRDAHPPVRLSHLRFFAEGPKCGEVGRPQLCQLRLRPAAQPGGDGGQPRRPAGPAYPDAGRERET
ncbi:MAG TPA: CpaD family pilus assembly lipoprotein [Rhodospirillales bacterium]